jgi:thiamine-phosphate pyrophosphorylase
MIRYAITGEVGGGEALREGLLAAAARWAGDGVEMVQLREKQVGAGELVELARAMLEVFRAHGGRTKLLVNRRADVAVAAGADGVHLTAHGDELRPEQVRQLFAAAGLAWPVVSASCHTVVEVQRAREAGVDAIVFGPVFEKRVGDVVVVPGMGIDALRQACVAAVPVPVLALGGVTAGNTADCLAAGAAGVAGIRLFGGMG